MVTVNIEINPFSNRYCGYSIVGKARPAKTQEVYRVAKSTYEELSEKYNSAKIKTDEQECYSVWDVRENKQAQAVMGLFTRTCKNIAKENSTDVVVNFISKL